jgi:FHS family L-fucose permease-like MFS transporter
VLGSEDGASSRLNLSQAFNSLGTAIAPLIGASYLLSDTIMSSDAIKELSLVEQDAYYINEAAAVQTPFIVLAACLAVIALLFMFIKLPKILQKSPRDGYVKLLGDKYVLMGVLAIFLYVGAEVAIGSYLVNYFMEMNMASIILENDTMSAIASSFLNTDLANVDAKAIVATFVVFYWSGAMVGRFIGSYLTRVIKPGFVLAVFASVAILLLLISVFTTGLIAMWSILAVGLFNSIMFPTIFTLTLDGQGDFKPQISGLLCMAIVGGAVVPPLYGLLTDSVGFKMAFILVIICYAYILWFGYLKQKKSNDFQVM